LGGTLHARHRNLVWETLVGYGDFHHLVREPLVVCSDFHHLVREPLVVCNSTEAIHVLSRRDARGSGQHPGGGEHPGVLHPGALTTLEATSRRGE
jgi:hypothetical protein